MNTIPCSTSALAKDGHLLGVTTECRNISLNPIQSKTFRQASGTDQHHLGLCETYVDPKIPDFVSQEVALENLESRRLGEYKSV
jgi:predicted metal-binding protein